MKISEFIFTFTSDNTKLIKGLSDSEKSASKAATVINKNLTGSIDKFAESGRVAGQKIAQAMDTLKTKSTSATSELKNTGGAVESLTSKLGKVAIASLAFDSIANFKNSLKSSLDIVDKLGKDAESIGIDVSDLNALQEAAGRAGGSADGVTNALSLLSKEAEFLSATGRSRLLPTFKELGLSLVDGKGKAKSSSQILRELAGVFGNISKQKSLGLGQKIGLDDGTIKLLQMGQVEFDKLIAKQKELGVATAEDAARAAVLNDELADLGQQTGHLKNRMFALVAEGLILFFNKMKLIVDFLKKNKAFAVSFFAVVGAAIAYTYLPAAIKAATATWAMIAPFAAVALSVAAVAAGIALIVDEIYNFIQGNDTLLGDFLSKYPVLENIVRSVFSGISSAFTNFLDLAKKVFSLITDDSKTFGEKLTTVFNKISNVVASVGRAIWGSLDEDGKKMMWLIDRLEDVKNGFVSMGAFIDNVLSSISETWSKFVNTIGDGVSAISDFFGVAGNASASLSSAASAAANNVSNSNYNTINNFDQRFNIVQQPLQSGSALAKDIAEKSTRSIKSGRAS
ncbi:MAG: hypothetical protein EBX50_01445 [Chitinophagia bacterium]|nr:hypothetical protein [Chitinophagia bacterium]